MSTTLGSVTNDQYVLPFDKIEIGISIVINTHKNSPNCVFVVLDLGFRIG